MYVDCPKCLAQVEVLAAVSCSVCGQDLMPVIQAKSRSLAFLQQSYATRLGLLDARGGRRFTRHFELAVEMLQAPFILLLDRDSPPWTVEEWRSSYVCRIFTVLMQQASIDYRAAVETTSLCKPIVTVWTILAELDHFAESVRDRDSCDLKPVAQLLILGVFLARWSDDVIDRRFLVDSVVDWGTALPNPIDFRSGSLEQWIDQFRRNAASFSRV